MPAFPRKEIYFDDKQLEAHGFPKEVSKAFLRTADDTNCVVMSRAPGGAGTELIRHGYDLKGFLIKAKSCNWGPMAGFLCQIPALNKYGAKKIAYNYKNHKKYLEYRQKHNILDEAAYIPLRITKARKDQLLKSATTEEDKSDVPQGGFFEPLGNDMVAGVAFVRDKNPEIDRSVVVEFLMVRSGKSGKRPELWSLYHGNIWYRQKAVDEKSAASAKARYLSLFTKISDKDGKIDRKKMPALFAGPVEDAQPAPSLGSGHYLGANNDKKAKAKESEKELDGLQEVYVKDVIEWQAKHLGEDYKAIDISGATEQYFSDTVKKFGIPHRPKFAKFYPICGAQNPYPPYRFRPMTDEEKKDLGGKSRPAYDAAKKRFEEEHSYKNAVTGDYDLFAVWPVKPPVGWEMLTRLAEQQIAWATRLEAWKQDADSFKGNGVPKREVSFFLDRAGKPFSLESRASPDLFVEVIPGFDEIGAWESEELGNINDATAVVASSLNATVSIAADRIGGRAAGRVAPNMAFHSDEGGRPGIDEVDYPFAVYLPRSLYKRLKQDVKGSKAQRETYAPKSQMLLIDTAGHADFLDLACMLREKCYLLFNHVWLMQMFVLLCDKKILTKPGIDIRGELDPQNPDREKLEALEEDRQKYFKARLAERETVDRDRIEARLTELFIGSQLRTQHKTTEVRNAEQESAASSLNKLSNAFQEIAAKDLGGKMGTVKRMMDRLRGAMISIPKRGEEAMIPKPPGNE